MTVSPDPVLANLTRLRVLAYLSGCREAEFSVVRDHCEVSDPTMSKTVTALETAGYVKARKGYVGKYPRTWLSATRAGRDALDAHLGALQTLVDTARMAAGAVTQPDPRGQAPAKRPTQAVLGRRNRLTAGQVFRERAGP